MPTAFFTLIAPLPVRRTKEMCVSIRRTGVPLSASRARRNASTMRAWAPTSRSDETAAVAFTRLW